MKLYSIWIFTRYIQAHKPVIKIFSFHMQFCPQMGALSHTCDDSSHVRGWLHGLAFNSPVNIIKAMSSRYVYLTTLFLGRLSPLNG